MLLIILLIIAAIIMLSYIVVAVWFHFSNPYAKFTWTKQPYTTHATAKGSIDYTEHFRLRVLPGRAWDMVGYLKQAYLIIECRYLVDYPIRARHPRKIIERIHQLRFNPSKPYLISGDQFSVLYPRNLGVFYNQLLNPRTALSNKDWQVRQRIYMQSTLYAIDGLSSNPTATTIIPLGGHTATATHVHQHDIASDAVYGVLYALAKMLSHDSCGDYAITTQAAAKRIIQARRKDLKHIVVAYFTSITNTATGLVDPDIAVSSARDGATRQSSFYDNVILWKTRLLANELGIIPTSQQELDTLRAHIDETFWLKTKNHYANDTVDQTFSGDWLIGYVTGFFDLDQPNDLARAQKIIDHIRDHKIAEPLPLKYQEGLAKEMPLFIKLFLPSYGSNAIWSYWGAQYITLLLDVYERTHNMSYLYDAQKYLARYERAMVRDHGYAETFSPKGKFLVSPVYRSIRITGWVVQHELAAWKFRELTKK